MPPTGDLRLTHHTSSEAAKLMDELCEVYADAYGAVPGEDTQEKSSDFRERARAAQEGVNYSLVTARIGDQLVGFAFGYSLRLGRGWWDGLKPEPSEGFTLETGSRTVVLSEIEVRRAWQGIGIGRMVHDAFLSQRTEERATLASNPKATDTHALYERWGWRRVGIVPGTSGAYYREYVLFTLPLPHATAGR
jgi:GNAT superfamily N-acetyltransferase